MLKLTVPDVNCFPLPYYDLLWACLGSTWWLNMPATFSMTEKRTLVQWSHSCGNVSWARASSTQSSTFKSLSRPAKLVLLENCMFVQHLHTCDNACWARASSTQPAHSIISAKPGVKNCGDLLSHYIQDVHSCKCCQPLRSSTGRPTATAGAPAATLCCTALHRTLLHSTALHCIVLHCTMVWLQFYAVFLRTMHYNVIHITK